MSLLLDIPDYAIAALDLPPERAREELRRELAVALYARGVLPIGKAMEFAGVTRREFDGLLKERGARRPFDAQELARELGTP